LGEEAQSHMAIRKPVVKPVKKPPLKKGSVVAKRAVKEPFKAKKKVKPKVKTPPANLRVSVTGNASGTLTRSGGTGRG